MTMIPIIIPMDGGGCGPLTKWERRYVTMVACCGLVGFAYGNLKMYEDIEERKKYGWRQDDMKDHMIRTAGYTSAGLIIGITLPFSVPAIMFYHYANRKTNE